MLIVPWLQNYCVHANIYYDRLFVHIQILLMFIVLKVFPNCSSFKGIRLSFYGNEAIPGTNLDNLSMY